MWDPDLEVRAGDTEPIEFKIEIGSDSELTLSSVNSMKLYARKDGSDTNHVDGAALSVRSLATSQNDDGTWTNTYTVAFDPTGAAASGGDAFDTGDEGIYLVYTLVDWADADETRHPNDDDRVWEVNPNYEG